MAISQLAMRSRGAALSTRSTAQAVGAAAVGGANPRLVGKSLISDIDKVVPGMGAKVASQGFKHPAVLSMIKKNPGKASAIAIAGGLGAAVMYDQLVDIANSDMAQDVRNWAVAAITAIDQINADAHIDDPTPYEDGLVGQTDIETIRIHAGLVSSATDSFERASAAIGGRQRLISLMEWFAIDDDLKQIVLDTEI